jgi:hypothetical protein
MSSPCRKKHSGVKRRSPSIAEGFACGWISAVQEDSLSPWNHWSNLRSRSEKTPDDMVGSTVHPASWHLFRQHRKRIFNERVLHFTCCGWYKIVVKGTVTKSYCTQTSLRKFVTTRNTQLRNIRSGPIFLPGRRERSGRRSSDSHSSESRWLRDQENFSQWDWNEIETRTKCRVNFNLLVATQFSFK